MRARNESRMRDTCRITKPGEGQGPWNPNTGSYDPPPPITVYEGKCRIPRRSSSTTSGSASETFAVGEFPLAIPVTGPEYVSGDEVAPGMTVTYLTAADDPSLAGHVFGITEPSRQSQATERRFVMKENVG